MAKYQLEIMVGFEIDDESEDTDWVAKDTINNIIESIEYRKLMDVHHSTDIKLLKVSTTGSIDRDHPILISRDRV